MSDSLAADLETHLAMSDDEDPAQPRNSTRGRKRTGLLPWIYFRVRRFQS